jgi:hypothetical protein
MTRLPYYLMLTLALCGIGVLIVLRPTSVLFPTAAALFFLLVALRPGGPVDRPPQNPFDQPPDSPFGAERRKGPQNKPPVWQEWWDKRSD